MEGDELEGATTLPIVHGKRVSSILAAFFMIFASLSSPILYFIGIFNIYYLAVLMVAMAIFLSCSIFILRDTSFENTRKVSKRLKIGMAVTFVAFAVGSPFWASLF